LSTLDDSFTIFEHFEDEILTRVFAYCRVSTADQTTDNQVQEIAGAGFQITPQRTITETVSGSVAANERKGFKLLLNKLEAEDVLVVTKLDRLGRNAMDVRATVEALAAMGVRVHCLALGGVDLTSPAGKMTMGVIAAVAEFERDLLIERTQAGLARAKAEGKTLGRPPALDQAQRQEARRRLSHGESIASIARQLKTSRATVMRLRQSPQ
jgi:putative DNA-invertase from lambdoid prophage Rac